MVRLYEARKVVLSSGQMQRRSWQAIGFADLDQCLENLRDYTEVTPEEEEHMRAQLPFVIAEFERQGFITEARLCELFPTFETLKTHVNMDGEGSSRRAGIHTHPHFIARKAAHVAAKRAEEERKASERAERLEQKEAKEAKRATEEDKRTALRDKALKLKRVPTVGEDWAAIGGDQQCMECYMWMTQAEQVKGLKHAEGKQNRWLGCDDCDGWYCGDHKKEGKVHMKGCKEADA